MRFELKMQEQYRAGREAGLAEGREEGREEGFAEGIEEGKKFFWNQLVEQLGEEAALKIMPDPNSSTK